MLDFGFYNMDCMAGMAQFPDKFFEPAIVDPPYAVGASDGNFGGKSKKPSKISGNLHGKHYANHDVVPQADYFDELFRVSKNQIVWGANYYPQHLYHSGWIVWDKLTTGPLSDCELAFESMDKLVRKHTSAWSGFVKQDGTGHSLERIHPNQKPVSLYKYLLQTFARTGDKILDTHVGSASSLIACHEMGFRYVGFELDQDYFRAATELLERAKAQVMMDAVVEVDATRNAPTLLDGLE